MLGMIMVVLVVIAQSLLFIFSWEWLISEASDYGRVQRGGVAFGATVYYGFILMVMAFFISSTVAVFSQSLFNRWLVIISLLGAWTLWIFPTLSSYPLRGLSLFFLGSSILIIGSGFFMPFIHQRVMSLALKSKERANKTLHTNP